MGKRRNGHMSERQLRMIELRAEGKTYSDIGKIFGLSIEGIRTNVRTAFRLLKRHGLDSLPPGCETRFPLNDLLSAGELRRNKTTVLKKPDNKGVFKMGYWGEIQNDYFSTDLDPKHGDMLANIAIDAWHVGEDQGQVVANVLLSKHGDVLVDYHDYVAMHDEMAQKAIGEAKDRLREYFRDLGHTERGNPDVQQHVSVETPIGEISVGITQLDPDYPGVYVDLKGQNVNAQFEKDTVALAVIEFNPEKKNIQTLVWQDANQEDYTFAVEYENLVVAPSLSKQIQSASTRAAEAHSTDKSTAKESTPER